jgi:ribonuclease Z
MSEIKPRHAVSYHSMEEALDGVRAGIRETYDGPLSVAVDNMVWNITRDKITERMVVSPDRASAVRGPTRQPPPERGRPSPMSEFIAEGEWGPAFNAQNKMLDEHSKKYNLEKMDWRKQKPWYKPSK